MFVQRPMSVPRRSSRRGLVRLAVVALLAIAATTLATAVTTPAAAEAAPQFTRKWGTLGGILANPHGVALDGSGDVYVADTDNSRVVKLTADGVFLSQWGRFGTGDGEFISPRGVALDAAGDVYVVDSGNNRVQKFTAAGVFVTQWGSFGSGDGEFVSPGGLAVDGSGDVLVADTDNHRVQRFTAAGVFVDEWGANGSGDGEFARPGGVAVDASGDVLVADTDNHRVQRFTAAGVFVDEWGANGSGDGEFARPGGLAVDASGDVFVADTGSHQVQQFTAAAAFVTRWTGVDGSTGQFRDPYGVAVDASGDVYVADTNNHRVQKFTSAGAFVAQWGSYGSGAGQFANPMGVAVDGSGDVYVTDRNNHRVQKFTSAGVFVTQWGTVGPGDGQFTRPAGVAVDGSGDVYVVDTGNLRVQKFTSTGVFITKWGGSGSGDGQFSDLFGVAVDGAGGVYVTDYGNQRVQKFTSAGVFLTEWGGFGSGDGEFFGPYGVGVDGAGGVYVTDTGNARVQKFTSAGVFVTKWGSNGSGDGQFATAFGVAADGAGNVYVADTDRHRVQQFSPPAPAPGLSVTKSADETEVVEGDTVHLHVTVTNTGNVDLSDVTIDDPNGPDCEAAPFALAVGADVTVDCTYVTTGADTPLYSNVASVTSDEVTTPVDSNQVDVAVTPPPTGVAGTVTETGTGNPVGGAFVAVLRTADFSVAAGATADAAGAFRIEVAPGSYFVYQVDPSGAYVPGFYGSPTTVVVTDGSVETVDPAADPTRGSVSGTVTEAGSGDPLDEVWALSLSTSPANTGALEVLAATSPSGTYSLAGLRPGNHFVGFVDPTGAHAPRFRPDSVSIPDSTPVPVAAGTVTSIDGVLPIQPFTGTGSVLSGTVTETGSGDPLAGIHVVVLRAADYAMVRGTVTDYDGHWEADIAAGGYYVAFVDPTATHDQEWFDGQPASRLAAATVAVAPGVADIDLDRNVGAFVGTVTDRDTGDPIQDAWVVVISPQGPAGGVTTASDGSYRVDGLTPGTYYLAFVDPNGGRTQQYWDGGNAFADADPLTVTGAGSTIADAALMVP